MNRTRDSRVTGGDPESAEDSEIVTPKRLMKKVQKVIKSIKVFLAQACA